MALLVLSAFSDFLGTIFNVHHQSVGSGCGSILCRGLRGLLGRLSNERSLGLSEWWELRGGAAAIEDVLELLWLSISVLGELVVYLLVAGAAEAP